MSAGFRKLFLWLLVFLAFCPGLFADMTIYLKDGGSRHVHKIVFKGDVAELYLLDGTLMSVPVSSIDLEGSGIGAPVGTYGETGIKGRSTVTIKRGIPVVDSASRQAELKSQWEEANVTATALKDLGKIHRGDVVRAFSPSVAGTVEQKRKRTYWYDEEEAPANPDEAYIIIYKNPDGTYGKKIMDAITFASSFEIQKPKSEAPPPSLPLPIAQTPEQPSPSAAREETPPHREEAPGIENKPAESQAEQPAGTSTAPESGSAMQAPQKSHKALILIVVGVLMIGAAVGAGVLLRKRQKPFVDTSRFARYEQDLREFELEIWLKHGKTTDQLMEICIKKFYQDTPVALNMAMKVWKGEQKSWIVPLIIKQGGGDPAEAEAIYNGLHQRINRIRDLIQEVSNRTGLRPVQSTGRAEAPKRVDQKPAPVVPTAPLRTARESAPASMPPRVSPSAAAPFATAKVPSLASPGPVSAPAPGAIPSPGVTSAVEASVPKLPPEPFPLVQQSGKIPVAAPEDMPSYAAAVLGQLALLSSPEEKLTGLK